MCGEYEKCQNCGQLAKSVFCTFSAPPPLPPAGLENMRGGGWEKSAAGRFLGIKMGKRRFGTTTFCALFYAPRLSAPA